MKSLKSVIFSLLIIILVIFLWFYRFNAAQIIRGFGYQEIYKLKLENESLKFKLASIQNQPAPPGDEYITADVYSLYPFNDQTKLIINRGEKDGLKEGMAVLAADGILLGRISAVKKNLSEVQTIFDPAWRSSVGIGESKIKALLVGAQTPLLTFIAKETAPAVGAEVINLSPEYPYGLLIGRVLAVSLEAAEPWAEAWLETIYNFNTLGKVLVVKEL